MHIQADPRERYTVLHLRGEFDTYYCPMLQQEIDGLVAAGVNRAVLNMRLVKFINSTALGAIIKASKALTSQGGALAISRPSSFVRDILEKVGLDRVVPVFDSDEAAGDSVAGGQEEPVLDDATILEKEDAGSVLFSPVDAERLKHFLPASSGSGTNPVHGHEFGKNWRGVGRMSSVDAEGLRFTWDGGNTGMTPFELGQLLALGTELKVKFRLPLLRKGHVDGLAAVTEIEERPDGVKVAGRFHGLDDQTQAAVRQYAEDMAFLKKELPGRNG
ncbi:STAS domain-containing protein [Engelhardtia mirabilis]|uniref:Anti-sigma factor antagonist n=1 Tax=Engelhardtia mirabilis TaxID=2528011 RepID=A0A518BJZ2_9BACT|nr:Anti-sigma-B factor antagonist [Planctomycetes bacterium Pla133]QDV01611.1 Anti-sigma-B factor antagonist [Planctomycetes bacterium Pla86]